MSLKKKYLKETLKLQTNMICISFMYIYYCVEHTYVFLHNGST